MADPRDEKRAASAGRNQALFREVNEAIERTHARFASDGQPSYICECLHEDCTERLPLAISEYEEVRGHPTYFIVLPGHIDDAVERVVYESPRYAVVEKLGAGAEVAAKLDPRSRTKQR